MAYVNLSHLPNPKTEYSTTLTNLYGGLNTRDLEYMLKPNESPDMKNLIWEDGMLVSRYGQLWNCFNEVDGKSIPIEFGETYSVYERGWHDYIFAHLGNKIWAFKIEYDKAYTSLDHIEIFSGGTDFNTRGTFFPYNEYLMYKTRGYYVRITFTGDEFVAENINENNPQVPEGQHFVGYTPVTFINCAPETGAGDIYQPENRLSDDKTLWYTAAYKVTASANNLSVGIEPFTWRSKVNSDGVYTLVYSNSMWHYTVGGITYDITSLTDYGINILDGTPTSSSVITVTSQCVTEYKLPIVGKELVKVVVDGTTLDPDTIDLTTPSYLEAEVYDQFKWKEAVSDTPGTYSFQYDGDKWDMTAPTVITDVDLDDYGIRITSGTPIPDSLIDVEYEINDYFYDRINGKVIFHTAPQVTFPATTNSVKITYRAENPTARANIMDCRFAETFGGVGDMAVVLAGSLTQPNAYFWCGQTSIAVDPAYFPMEQYQLAGATTDDITGFGKQASYLIIFKRYSTGRTSFGTQEVNGRTVIDLPYTPINARTGCDLPWTIQLVNDNLVWCNTDMGVHVLKDSSAAYENNIVCLSEKVNGGPAKAGLTEAVRSLDPEQSCSLDDGHRYWLAVGGKCWVWDYEISDYKNPSWFFLTNIDARGFAFEKGSSRHFDSRGRLTIMERVLYDYDPFDEKGAIDKSYTFAVQTFNTFDVLKNVNSLVFSNKSGSNTTIKLEYITDYEEREDLTPLTNKVYSIFPRDLRGKDSTPPFPGHLARNLKATRFFQVYRRRPRCLRVRHFTMRLSNNTVNEDLSIVSVQIFYTFQGRQR